MSKTVKVAIIALLAIILVVLVLFVVKGVSNKSPQETDVETSEIVDFETEDEPQVQVTQARTTRYVNQNNNDNEDDEEVTVAASLTPEQLAELSVIDIKPMSGLYKFGNYRPLSQDEELADVPSFETVMENAELLYSGVLADYPTITAYITSVPVKELCEPYLEVLRRCGFTDLNIPKYYGYMVDGKHHAVYLKTAAITLVNTQGEVNTIGETTVVLVNYPAQYDVKDRTRAFIGYDMGEFDELTVKLYE